MVRKRGEKFYVKVYDPDAASGQRWLGTYETETEALREDAKWTLRRHGHSNETCDSFAHKWAEEVMESDRTPATKAMYRRAARRFALEFGELPLDMLKRGQAHEYATRRPEAERNALRVMLGVAKKRDLAATNVFAKLGIPLSRGRMDLDTITAAELIELANGAVLVHGDDYGREFRSLILFTAMAGLRAGEVCALKWIDVMERAGMLRVRRAIDCFGNYGVPKNEGLRTIGLPEEALAALHGLPRDREFVFLSMTGRPLLKTSLFYAWNPVRKAFRPRPQIQFHELRHFCATWLATAQGLSSQEAAMHLGHRKDGKVAERIYIHRLKVEVAAKVRGATLDEGGLAAA